MPEGSEEAHAVILIVDDDPAVGRAIARLLASRYRCRLVDGVRAALRLLEAERVDALLCDLVMPEQNGVDLFDALSAERPEAARRVVFMTGGIQDPDLLRRLERTGRPVLYKPLGCQALVSALDAAIRG